MKSLILSLMFFSISFNTYAQSKKLKLKDFKIQVLSDTLREISGLTELNQKVFAINDGGNSSSIYEIKPESPHIQKVYKTNLRNHDWEAIENDGTHFYIGDFGNNLGTRKDLVIYKIPFYNEELKLDSIQKIPFYYPEQKDFTPKNLNTDFDAEAMIYYQNTINVFTKAWETKKVVRYAINPNISENQEAVKLEDFQLRYVVTDADFYLGKLYFVGYTKTGNVFLSIFKENESNLFFQNPETRYNLGSALTIGQIEGIVALEKGLLISSEAFDYKIGKVQQSLYFVAYEYLE